MTAPAPGARYDGHADWYDAWAHSDGATAMAAARATLDELVPSGSGLAHDLGCDTGLHADVVRRRGYTVVGVDVSADQLRLARSRLRVIRAEGGALPCGTASRGWSSRS
jgi:predicted TPR repeat methyltransferase